MTNNTTFRRAADRTRKSAFVLPIWLVYFVLFLISIVIMREDIMTSLWGYEALPTEQGYAITAWAIGLLPSIGQLATGYVVIALADNDNDKGYMIFSSVVWVVLFLVDCYTDLFFRNGYSWNVSYELWATSLFQTISIFTLGSELFFVLGFGMMMELLPDALVEFFGIGRKIKNQWNSKYSMARPKTTKDKNRRKNETDKSLN